MKTKYLVFHVFIVVLSFIAIPAMDATAKDALKNKKITAEKKVRGTQALPGNTKKYKGPSSKMKKEVPIDIIKNPGKVLRLLQDQILAKEMPGDACSQQNPNLVETYRGCEDTETGNTVCCDYQCTITCNADSVWEIVAGTCTEVPGTCAGSSTGGGGSKALETLPAF